MDMYDLIGFYHLILWFSILVTAFIPMAVIVDWANGQWSRKGLSDYDQEGNPR